MPVGSADVGSPPARGVCELSHVRVRRRRAERLTHRAVFGDYVERYLERRRRREFCDAVVVVGPCADLEVGVERLGDLLAHKLFQRHAGDPSHNLTDEVAEVEHVITRRGARRPPWGMAGQQRGRLLPVIQVFERERRLPPGYAGRMREDVANLDVLLAV